MVCYILCRACSVKVEKNIDNEENKCENGNMSPATEFLPNTALSRNFGVRQIASVNCYPYIFLMDHCYTKSDKVRLHFVHKLVGDNWGNNSEVLVNERYRHIIEIKFSTKFVFFFL